MKGLHYEKLLSSKVCNNDSNFKVQFNNILDVWEFEYDGEPDLKSAAADEVIACKWLSVSEIRQFYGF